MSTFSSAPAVISAASYVTLHYRLSTQDDGSRRDIISTFDQHPATLQLGAGQWSPSLESRLYGLAEGEARVFELGADEAFGTRRADLVQKVARHVYDEEIDPQQQFKPGDQVPIPAPDTGHFQGLLKALTPQYALFDFNHPLAGQPLSLEVKIIGIL